MTVTHTKDAIIIGAGPAGLSCAIEAERNQLDYLVLERGCIVNAIYNFPKTITFFTTPDLLEIGDTTFITNSFRPNREEVLNYYSRVVKKYSLKIKTFEEVTALERNNLGLKVLVKTLSGMLKQYYTKKVVLATGYYDNPNLLGVKGEELPKVSHYYTEGHPYYEKNVAVIGGGNSAVEAALDLYRHGAKVTMLLREKSLNKRVKYWILPDIEKRIKSGEVRAIFNSKVMEILPEHVLVKTKGRNFRIKNDFVFAMTGYRPDIKLLEAFGVKYDPKTLVPIHTIRKLKTNVNGVYLAGAIISGINNNKVFIENSREHGKLIFG